MTPKMCARRWRSSARAGEQLANLLTHEVSLRQADLALRLIGQEVPGEEAIHVAINPWRD